MIDKDELKKSLTIEQIYDLVAELGGEPQQIKNNYFVSRTICHNPAGQGSYKLYYYDNGEEGIFHCYTDCGSFDIFELVRKQKSINDKVEWTLIKAIFFVASYFGFSSHNIDFGDNKTLPDWDILNNYDKLNNIESKQQIVQLKVFDKSILKHLPQPIILPWEKEGISREVIEHRDIAYNPVSEGIVIPHYDIDNKLIGIRERTLVRENEIFGKYRPAILNGKMYNHPLSFNLYNINNSKEAIKVIKKAIIFEAEKSTMEYASFFGEENDISVACCGSSLITYQVKLLLSLGVKEIVIAFDRQYRELNDEEHKKWVKKLKDIHKKYSPYVQISFVFDIDGLLGYKESPTNRGKEIFLELFKRRIIL